MVRFIGFHIGTSDKIENAASQARDLEITAFSTFLGNPTRWRRMVIDDRVVRMFRRNCEDCGFTSKQIVIHSNYLANLGHPDDFFLRKSRDSLADEVRCCEKLGIDRISFHPGNHLGKISWQNCLNRIADSVNLVIDDTDRVTLAVENTAGQGNDLGFRFEQLAYIIDRVEDKARIGMCFDTCHAFAAGYDLRNSSRCEEVFEELGKVMSCDRLQVIHLNNTRHELGRRVDRHQPMHRGTIDDSTFSWIVKLADRLSIPVIIESGSAPQERELSWVRSQIRRKDPSA